MLLVTCGDLFLTKVEFTKMRLAKSEFSNFSCGFAIFPGAMSGHIAVVGTHGSGLAIRDSTNPESVYAKAFPSSLRLVLRFSISTCATCNAWGFVSSQSECYENWSFKIKIFRFFRSGENKDIILFIPIWMHWTPGYQPCG